MKSAELLHCLSFFILTICVKQTLRLYVLIYDSSLKIMLNNKLCLFGKHSRPIINKMILYSYCLIVGRELKLKGQI